MEPANGSDLGWTGAFIEYAGAAMELAGVGVIVIGSIVATIAYLNRLRTQSGADAYAGYRVGLARSILLGLELLVAGDIIRTVVVAPTLLNVALLAGIVLIRTFLSFTLELEISGRWPWRRESGEPHKASRRPV